MSTLLTLKSLRSYSPQASFSLCTSLPFPLKLRGPPRIPLPSSSLRAGPPAALNLPPGSDRLHPLRGSRYPSGPAAPCRPSPGPFCLDPQSPFASLHLIDLFRSNLRFQINDNRIICSSLPPLICDIWKPLVNSSCHLLGCERRDPAYYFGIKCPTLRPGL